MIRSRCQPPERGRFRTEGRKQTMTGVGPQGRTGLAALAALAVCLAAFPAGAEAQERTQLGYGRLVTNDLIGSFRDRWRTGSISSSRVYGYGWDRQLPEQAGDLIELRLRGELVAPVTLSNPAPADRPFAGILSIGAHTHYRIDQTEVSFGADIAVTGPQTGLSDLQTALHDTLGIASLSQEARDNQIEDGVHPTVLVELGRSYDLGGTGQLRPFVEAQAGLETFLRAGVDLQIGRIGTGDLMVREPVTGHRYRTIRNDKPGMSFVFGGDVARVADSVLLPESRGYTLSDTRNRLRAGVHWQGAKNSAFYGLTWLGEEFKAQTEGQIVGSLRLNFEF